MIGYLILGLIIGGAVGCLVPMVMTIAKDSSMHRKAPYTIDELRSLCLLNESKTTHIWIRDNFGVFPSLAGCVDNHPGKGVHVEAAYSLDESVYFGELDYGEVWLAFPTKEAAEDFSWSLS